MPSIDEGAKRWQLELAGRVGRAVQDRRKWLGWTALDLSQRTDALGYPVSRAAVAKIESNSRAGKLDLGELLVLAAALNTSPVALVYPGPDYGQRIEALPDMWASEIDAAEWFSAMAVLPPLATHKHGLDRIDWRESVQSLTDWRTLLSVHRARAEVVSRGEFDRDREQIAFYDEMIRRLRERLRIADDA